MQTMPARASWRPYPLPQQRQAVASHRNERGHAFVPVSALYWSMNDSSAHNTSGGAPGVGLTPQKATPITAPNSATFPNFTGLALATELLDDPRPI